MLLILLRSPSPAEKGCAAVVALLHAAACELRGVRKGIWMRKTIMGVALGLAQGLWSEDRTTSGKVSSLGNSQAGGSCGGRVSCSFGASGSAGAPFGASATGASASVFASAARPVHELGIPIAAMALAAGEALVDKRSTGTGEASCGSGTLAAQLSSCIVSSTFLTQITVSFEAVPKNF